MTESTMAQQTQPYAHTEIPFNLYKQAAPLAVKLIENTKLTGDKSPNDVRHLVFSLEGTDYRYLDGQSAGIVPPGNDASGKPHKIRLYSIASPSVGDDGEGKSLTLCVKRLEYTDAETQEVKKGVCSNYLCDLQPGTMVNVTGPTGKAFFMPETKDANMIMVATGTGIAPFRAFLHTRYTQRRQDAGQTWMFFGAQYHSDFLYQETLESYNQYDSYHLRTAFSREETTVDGRKVYVQDRLAEDGTTILKLLQNPNTYFYICGLKGMEHGILEALQAAAAREGANWDALFADLNTQKRWRVEVY